MPSSASNPTLPGGLSGAATGFGLAFKALGLIFKTPRLLGLAALAAVVTAGVLLLLFMTALPVAQKLSGFVLTPGDGWRWALGGVLTALFFILVFAISALTVPHLVLAPLEDPLSQATDRALGRPVPERPFSLGAVLSGTVRSALHTVLRLGFMVAGVVALLPLHFVPLVGNVASMVLSFLWASWWAATEYAAGPAARQGWSFFTTQRALRARAGATLGLGGALFLLLWVPVLQFFLVPVAVVSGTLLFRRLEASPEVGTR